jgi:hypothetical protein
VAQFVLIEQGPLVFERIAKGISVKSPIRLVLGATAGLTTLASASLVHAALDDLLTDQAKDVAITKIAGQTLRVRERGNVKEFADASGKVFAASWHGPTSFPVLLGAHYAEYQAALKAQKLRSLHVAQVSTPELHASVVVYGRYTQGQIVLVKRLPKGVTVDALR